jgi:HK97 family phage major capsid protein
MPDDHVATLQDANPEETVTYKDLQEFSEALNETFFGELHPYLEKVKELYEDEDGTLPPAVQKTVDRMNDHMDELETTLKEKRLQYESDKDRPREPEKVEAYKAFLNHSGQNLYDISDSIKTLTSDEGSSGGYLVPAERAQSIISKARATSPVRQYATVQQITQGETFEQPVRDTEFETVWSGNQGTDPGDTSTSTFDLEKIPTHTQLAKVPVTMQMLEDSQYDVESFVESEVTSDFAQAEATAFVDGNGVNKPEGILQDGRITTVNSGDSSAITYGDGGDPGTGLLGLVYDIEEERYVQNARLMFNRKTLANIRGLTDSNGEPIYDPGNADEGPSVEGTPYSTATDLPTVSSGANAMIFGDFSYYVIVDRIDIMMQRDAQSAWPTVKFKFRKRVGGQVVVPEAFRVMTISS